MIKKQTTRDGNKIPGRVKIDPDLKKKMDELFPDDYDEFKDMVKDKTLPPGKKLVKCDTDLLKRRAYELIIKGHTSNSYIPTLSKEFSMAPQSVQKYIKGLREEDKIQYEEVHGILREAIVQELILIKNNTNVVHEKLKCLELIVKITGLLTENINVTTNQEERTFVMRKATEEDNIIDIKADDVKEENNE